jgi:hypothetical protein
MPQGQAPLNAAALHQCGSALAEPVRRFMLTLQGFAPLLYLGLFVKRVLPVKGTVFAKFQFFLGVAPVFLGGIIAPLALTALQGYQFYCRFLARHISTP